MLTLLALLLLVAMAIATGWASYLLALALRSEQDRGARALAAELDHELDRILARGR